MLVEHPTSEASQLRLIVSNNIIIDRSEAKKRVEYGLLTGSNEVRVSRESGSYYNIYMSLKILLCS